jgi:hypothetical protein
MSTFLICCTTYVRTSSWQLSKSVGYLLRPIICTYVDGRQQYGTCTGSPYVLAALLACMNPPLLPLL